MEQQNRITGIIGRKGAGKSRKAREILQCAPRLFVFDTMGEHEFVPNTCRDLQEAEEFLAWAEMQGTFAGRFIPDDDIEGTFTVTAQWVYEQGEMLFAV